MTPTTTPPTIAKAPASPAEIQKNIEMHKKTAEHLEAAAKQHIEAAKHHEEGHHDKAAISTVKAEGHLALAGEARREDVKHHALKS